jgi:hypothetical protein
LFPRIDKGPTEYVLTVSRAYSPERARDCVRFSFRTNEEFQYFMYVISTDSRVIGDRIEISLKGLQTKGVVLPGGGHARSTVDLFDLDGRYEVTIAKPGPVTTRFQLNITRKSIKVQDPLDVHGSFLQLIIDGSGHVS